MHAALNSERRAWLETLSSALCPGWPRSRHRQSLECEPIPEIIQHCPLDRLGQRDARIAARKPWPFVDCLGQLPRPRQVFVARNDLSHHAQLQRLTCGELLPRHQEIAAVI